MKTSNVIIISLISSLLLIILTAALDLKLYGEYRSWKTNKLSVEKSASLQSINHIVVNDISVTIEQTDINQVSVLYKFSEASEDRAESEKLMQNSQTIPDPVLKISGDTLFIDEDIARGQENNNHVSISISDHLQSVTGKNSNITIKGGLTKSIDVEGNNLFISGSKIERQFSHIDLTAKNARVNIITALDTLSLQLENSHADIRNPVGFLKANLKNNTRLNTHEAKFHMDIEKDLSSKIQVY